jgi:hypothetical protein
VKKLELPSKVWYKGTSPFVVVNESRQAFQGDVNPWRAFLTEVVCDGAPYGRG